MGINLSMNPKVSIITVCLNSLDSLKKTITSVQEQSLRDFEHIVVDGCSGDGTVDYLDFMAKDLKNFYYISEPDKGIYHAMNKGIAISRGKWIIFMNAGDYFFSSNNLIRILENASDDFDFIYGDRVTYDGDGNQIYQKAEKIAGTVKKEVVFHQALLTKGALLRKFPYNLNYKYASDFDYIVKGFLNGRKFLYLNFPFCYFERGGLSRQNHIEVNIEASNIIAKRIGLKELKKSDFYHGLISNGVSLVFNEISNQLKKNKNQILFDNNFRNLKLMQNDKEVERKLNNFLGPIFPFFGNFIEEANEDSGSKFLVTIVTVVFNDKDGILKTIDSIKSQNYLDFEYVVVDGGSSDGTSEVLEDNSLIIDRYLSERDNGIYDAMNKGVSISSGDYVIFMNAGDTFFDENTLSLISSNLESRDFDVVYGDRIYVDDSQEVYQAARNVDDSLIRMPYCHQSVFVKRELLAAMPFDTTYRFAADYDQVLRFIESSASFKRMENIPVCKFYAGGASESGLEPHLECVKIQIDHIKRTKKNKSEISKSIYFKSLLNNFQKYTSEYIGNV